MINVKPVTVFLLSAFILSQAQLEYQQSVLLPDTRLRDPHILTDTLTDSYYLVSSLARPAGAGRGISVFTSTDLETWNGPVSVYDLPAEGFWGTGGLWAPEIHEYEGKYYIFVTFHSDEEIGEQWENWPARIRRATVILWSDSPLGPFQEFHSESQATPRDMMALDGTLWVEDGAPYMIYCHEWVQIRDGTIEVIPLTEDLSEATGEPTVLFAGSDAIYADSGRDSYVTDGGDPYRTRTGELIMIWSGFGPDGYAVGVAVSESGSVMGPWTQAGDPLFTEDGGHGVIFKTFEGVLMLALHSPNSTTERARLFYLEDMGNTVRLSMTPHTYPLVSPVNLERKTGLIGGAPKQAESHFSALGQRADENCRWSIIYPLLFMQ
jgi:beta-xylosidase